MTRRTSARRTRLRRSLTPDDPHVLGQYSEEIAAHSVLPLGVLERTHWVGAGASLLDWESVKLRCSAMTDVVFDQFLKALERTERMPLRDLARYQEQLLIRLVRHASENLPFYRRRLSPLFTADGGVDLSRWNDLPILTRDEALAHGAEMRVAALSDQYGVVGEFQTSGSTGVPLTLASNALVSTASNALFTRWCVGSASTHRCPWPSFAASPMSQFRPTPKGKSKADGLSPIPTH
jgi:hypothetical protein